MIQNYTLPLQFGNLMKRDFDHVKCDLTESVRRHIYMILLTRYGEHRFDYNYGCDLWKYDFDSPNTIDRNRPHLEKSLKDTLTQMEPRLNNLRVSITISQEDFTGGTFKKIPKIKRKIEIKIIGKLVETNGDFTPPVFVVYFSPMLTDSK